jgi:hypothetical protein
MLKFMTAAVAAAVLVFATQATSEAAGRRRCTTAAPVYQAAAPVAMPALAAAPSGYRSFSYEPAAPTYRSSSMRRSYSNQPSFLDAGSKALGRFGK